MNENFCYKFCDNSVTKFTLTNVPNNATIDWTFNGGIPVLNNNLPFNERRVQWQGSGFGSVNITINTGSSIINKTICIEKKISPTANFEIVGAFQDENQIYACYGQTLQFSNLSLDNNGPNIVNYYWDFGDGTFSNQENPTHMYNEQNEYLVTLTVTNSCFCSSTMELYVNTKERGFDISCPGLVCSNQNKVYSLPQNALEICPESNIENWSVEGGEIINHGNGFIEVLWNQDIPSGFGTVTYSPINCGCMIPTSINVPVITPAVEIEGQTSLCVNEQYVYSIPKWATTAVTWSLEDSSGIDVSDMYLILTDQRNEIVVSNLPPGIYNLNVDYFNTLTNCGGKNSIRINVNNTNQINGETVICVDEPLILQSTNNQIVNWQLYNVANILIEEQNSSNFNFTINNAGDYYIMASSDDSCPSMLNIKILNKPSQPSSIIGESIICENVSYSYSVSNPESNAIYQWEVINGTILGSSIGNSVDVVFDGNAILSVYNQALEPIICNSEITQKNISVQNVNAHIYSENQTLCANSNTPFELRLNGTTNLYENEDATIEWFVSNSDVGSISNGQGTSEISITWNNIQQQEVVFVSANVTICGSSQTFSIPITVIPIPQISINPTAANICADTDFTFTVSAISGTLNPNAIVKWKINNVEQIGGLQKTISFINNSATQNATYLITAQVLNVNGCSSNTNIVEAMVTVLPNPRVTLSLVGNVNTFCLSSDISATVQVALPTSISSVNYIKWFKKNSNGTITFLPSSNLQTSYNISSSTGFGAYYYQVQFTNGCVKKSNEVFIYRFCAGNNENPCSVVPSPVVTNSSVNNCGMINLIGTATTGYIGSPKWDVLGPVSLVNFSGSSFVAPPGVYKIFYKATYPCAAGGSTSISAFKEVVVPYVANFQYATTCSNNNQFTVNFTDNSVFYEPVTDRNSKFYYATAANPTTWILYNGQILGTGIYKFKIVISGKYNNIVQPSCEKIIENIVLTAIGNASIYVVTDPIKCHDTPVKFKIIGLGGSSSNYSYLWSYDGVTNTMHNPDRIFSTPGLHQINVTVTNQSGCSLALAPVTIVVPERCYQGEINAPVNTACKGETITLTYDNTADNNCSGTSYQWMNLNGAIANENGLSLTANAGGLYWLKISNTNNCTYESNRINLQFINPPSVFINGNSTFCVGDAVVFNAISETNQLQWFIDGGHAWYLDNQNTIDLSFLEAGVHTIEVTALSTACPNANSGASLTFEINDVPSEPVITIIDNGCSPLFYTLMASLPGNENAVFNWSNGVVGNINTVTMGGPMGVTAHVNGCSASSQIYLPQSHDNYLWMFPTGCFETCREVEHSILGLPVYMQNWSYLHNNHNLISGHEIMEPLNLHESGSYNMWLDNGFCETTSEPLHFEPYKCNECILIKDSRTYLNEGACVYTLNLQILNPFDTIISIQLQPQLGVVFSTSTFVLIPGINSINVNYLLLNSINGISIPNSTSLELNITTTAFVHEEWIHCNSFLYFDLEPCNNQGKPTNGKQLFDENLAQNGFNFAIMPNPSREETTTLYMSELKTPIQVLVYDIMGRKVLENTIPPMQNTHILPLSNFEKGIYWIQLQNNNQIIGSTKLIRD